MPEKSNLDSWRKGDLGIGVYIRTKRWLHADHLGHDAYLRADVAVANDAKRFAAHLVAAGRDLAPLAFMHLA